MFGAQIREGSAGHGERGLGPPDGGEEPFDLLRAPSAVAGLLLFERGGAARWDSTPYLLTPDC